MKIESAPATYNAKLAVWESVVTIKNQTSDPISGPIQLIVVGASPLNTTLANYTGRDDQGRKYVDVPAPAGLLNASSSLTALVRFSTPASGIGNPVFALNGVQLSAANSATINVAAFAAGGPTGETPGSAVGSGYSVAVNGVLRGTTDASGRISLKVPLAAGDVTVYQGANNAGTFAFDKLSPGQTLAANVLVGDGAENYLPSTLHCDQVVQDVLPASASTLTCRFQHSQQDVNISRMTAVTASTDAVSMNDLSSLFKVSAGALIANASAVKAALGSAPGKVEFNMIADDVNGNSFNASTIFYIADRSATVQVLPPASNPGIGVSNLVVRAHTLNGIVDLYATTDARGFATLNNLPSGVIRFDVATTSGGITYSTQASIDLESNATLTLNLLGPGDVPAQSMPAPRVGAGSSNSRTQRPIRSQTLARIRNLSLKNGAATPQRSSTMASATRIQVDATPTSQNAMESQSGVLTIPQGTKFLHLIYTASSFVPGYAEAGMPLYHDTWSLQLLSSTGGSLFEISRDVVDEITQFPAWVGATTLPQYFDVDVSALTASGPMSVTLRATALNVWPGMGGYWTPTTWVTSALSYSSAQQIVIKAITPDSINTRNDGSYYSVPRLGNQNVLQRSFTLDISKPSGSSITSVSVDSQDGDGNTLMCVTDSVAPGQDGVQILAQEDTQARLGVRVTVKSPASTVSGTPPATNALGFAFTVAARDGVGNIIQAQSSASGKHALWKMPDGIARYGSRDFGGDDWAASGAYAWMQQNQALFREVNDVSGEHGKYLKHETHAKGTDIDAYHFYLFPGITTAPGQGQLNHVKLRQEVVASFGTLLDPPTPGAADSKGRVSAWIQATRSGLQALADNGAVKQVIHCLGIASDGLPAGWCAQVLKTGKANRVVNVNGVATAQTLDFGTGAWSNSKMLNNDIHDDHIHITLDPSALGS